MRQRTRSLLGLVRFAVPVFVALGCGSDMVSPKPLTLLNGTPVDVHVVASAGNASVGSVVQVTAVGDSVRAVWKVDAPGCLLASATGEYSGPFLVINIVRSANPLADCIPGNFPNIYEATTARLPSGSYEVHVVDAYYGKDRVEVGRAVVTVP